MDKYGIKKEYYYDGKHYINTVFSNVSLKVAEKYINDEMESYKRTLQHINKTIKLTLFTYDNNYFRQNIYTKAVTDLLN